LLDHAVIGRIGRATQSIADMAGSVINKHRP
jgi:hypothetical protein